MIERVAYLSMHTSPLLQPGSGDAGGMNVYIDELASTMAARGVEVDVFTRRHDPRLAATVWVGPGYRVHHVPAGPAHPLPIAAMARHVRPFAAGVMDCFQASGTKPAIIHSNYWLSGWAGLVIKRALGIPHAISFHTLGRVKEATRRDDDRPESLLRIAAEHEVIEEADCVVAATPLEAEDLLEHYHADPARLCTSPPGVDHAVFRPGDQASARRELGWDADVPVVLFVGRIQPLKGADVIVQAMRSVVQRLPDARLMLVGGPSGPNGERELSDVVDEVGRLGLGDHIEISPPVPHLQLAEYYRAADVVSVPSRSESFGLVAAEAQACGRPVVAARVGGLVHVVSEGVSGILVDGWRPEDHADALLRVLTDDALARHLAAGAEEWSERFSWDATANRFLELYDGAIARVDAG